MKIALLALALAAPTANAALPAAAPLSWSRPGADPYRGTVREALASMHLPRDVAARLADRIERGQADGTVSINDAGIHADDGEVFAPHFDMTTGRAIASGSRSNLGPGRVERGALYRDGVYAVAVPSICNNATRLYPAGWPHFAPPPVLAVPHVDLPALLPPGGDWSGAWWPGAHGFAPPAYLPPGMGPGPVGPGVMPVPVGPGLPGSTPVPLPSSLLLLFAGAAAVASIRRHA